MIFLRLCCVRMYAAFCPKYRYIGRMLTGRAYIWERESRQVKSAKNLTVNRNGFTESRFPKQKNQCAEPCEITRFETMSHGTGKAIGVTYEQDITPAILSGFDDNRNFYDTAKQVHWRVYLLFCFII